MPQTTVEITENISQLVDLQNLLLQINLTAHDVLGVNLNNCKSRVHPLRTFQVGGSNNDSGFIAIRVAIFTGFDHQDRQTLSEKIAQIVSQNVSKEQRSNQIQISVEIQEIDPSTYAKISL